MNARTIITVACIGVLLLAAGSGVANAGHGDNVFEWVDDAMDDDDYGIEDPYMLFSADDDRFTNEASKEELNQSFDNDSDLKTFHEAGDFTRKRPIDDVIRWNNQNRYNFDAGGAVSSSSPFYWASGLTNSSDGYIQDAHIRFYAINPSTVVHKGQSVQGQDDDTRHRIGTHSDITVMMDARVEKTPNGPEAFETTSGRTLAEYEEQIDKKWEGTVEEFNVEDVQLDTTGCEVRPPCHVDDGRSISEEGQVSVFENLESLNAGPQGLVASATYKAEIKYEMYDRQWLCAEDDEWVSYEEYQSLLAEQVLSDDEELPDCWWSDWEVEGTQYKTDSVEVQNHYDVTVEDGPNAEVRIGDLPGNRMEYYVEGLDQGEWTQMAFEQSDDSWEVGVRSAYRYFSSQNTRWRYWCERQSDRDNKDAASGECDFAQPRGSHTTMHTMPVMNHAITSPDGVTDPGPNTNIRYENSTFNEYPMTNAQNHTTCQGVEMEPDGCYWEIMMYGDVDEETATYQEPDGLVVQRFSETENIRIDGLVEGVSGEADITNRRDVRLAQVSYKEVEDGQHIDDELRERREARGENVPDEDEVRLRVEVWDNRTGEPIDVANRSGYEYVQYTPPKNTWSEYINNSPATPGKIFRPGENGTAYIVVEKSNQTGTLRYAHEDWWETPEHEQAYVSPRDIVVNPDGISGNPWSVLFQLVIFLSVPFLALKIAGKVIGFDIKKEDMMMLLRGK